MSPDHLGKINPNPTEEELLSLVARKEGNQIVVPGSNLRFDRFFIPVEETWRNLIGKKDIKPQAENPNIEYLYKKKPEITEYMGKVKDIANGNRTPDDLAAVFDYCLPLGRVYKLLALEAIEKVGDSAIVYAPDNGGLYVKWVLEQVLEDKKVNWKFFNYRMSRIPVDCGPYGKRLGVGTIFHDYLDMIRSFKNQLLYDDCVATDVSLKETFNIIEETWGEEIKNCDVSIFTSVANETTLNNLEHDVSKRANRVHAISGIPNYCLNEHGSLVEENGDATVSDMGSWTKRFKEISEPLQKALF
jgi:hypothetical protein